MPNGTFPIKRRTPNAKRLGGTRDSALYLVPATTWASRREHAVDLEVDLFAIFRRIRRAIAVSPEAFGPTPVHVGLPKSR